MAKNIFLHIGIHKTGTTSIQKFLWDNYESLLSEGFLYPKEIAVDYAHHKIPWSLAERFKQNSIAKKATLNFNLVLKLKTILESNKAENIIFSSENFCFFTPDEIKNLFLMLKDHNVQILLYVRSQDRLIESEYIQRVDQSECPEKRSFYQFINVSKFVLPQSNYYNLIVKWKIFFPNIKILYFLHTLSYLVRYLVE